ncbi:MAG: formate dehydrogenase accessory protein FdhE [Chloroflexota bacterium]
MTTGMDVKILKRLEEWEGKEGSLPKTFEVYRRLLNIQAEARARAGVPSLSLSDEAITNRLMNGSPILRFDDLSLDWALLWKVFGEVVGVCASYPEILDEVPENLEDSDSCRAHLKEATKAWYEGSQLSPQLSIGGLHGALLEFIIQAVLRPFLLSHSEALISRVDQEHWRRGYCPICGGSPDFAVLENESGGRWLLCSRCDAQWLFQRLECPYCGTQEMNALNYFTDDEGLYRLYVCERCRHYLKAIDLRRANYEVLLPLERYLTLDLDLQANKDKYIPGVEIRQGDEVRR